MCPWRSIISYFWCSSSLCLAFQGLMVHYLQNFLFFLYCFDLSIKLSIELRDLELKGTSIPSSYLWNLLCQINAQIINLQNFFGRTSMMIWNKEGLFHHLFFLTCIIHSVTDDWHFCFSYITCSILKPNANCLYYCVEFDIETRLHQEIYYKVLLKLCLILEYKLNLIRLRYSWWL